MARSFLVLCLFAALLAARPVLGAAPPVAPPAPGEALAARAQVHWDTVTRAQGLPSGTVFAVQQDRSGFLWIGTYGGLARYDGYQVRSYLPDPQSQTGLPAELVRALLPDPSGGIWIGTGGGGIVRYDPLEDRFQRLPGEPAGLNKSQIYTLIPDGGSGFWAGHHTGLAHYAGPDAAGAPQWESVSAESGLALGQVFAVLRDRAGNLWAGGAGGLAVRRAGASTFTIIPADPAIRALGQSPIWSLYEDAQGVIWVGFDGIGVARVESGELKPVPGLSGPTSPVGTKTVRGFLEPVPDQLWIATFGAGIVVRDQRTGATRSWRSDVGTARSLGSDFVRALFQDRSGIVHAATDRGFSYTNPGANGILMIETGQDRPDTLRGKDVQSVAGTPDGRVWVGFGDGQIEVIEPGGPVRRVRPAPGVAAKDLPDRAINRIARAPDGTMIAGSYGLYGIDPDSLTIRRLDAPELANKVVISLLAQDQVIWAGTHTGLWQVDLAHGTRRELRHVESDPTSLPDDFVREIVAGRDGRLWISTHRGLCRLDPARLACEVFRHAPEDPTSLPTDDLQGLMVDDEDRLWIGTWGHGLAYLDKWTEARPGAPPKPRFRTLGRDSGLPDATVYALAKGVGGKIWISFPNGLGLVGRDGGSVQLFTATDGARLETAPLASPSVLTDGTVLLPAAAGVTVIRPDLATPWAYDAPLVVTEARVGDRLVPGAALGPATRLRLKPGETGFTVEFALLDFSAPGLTRYRYFLDGLDKGWSDAPVGRRSATYTNLAPGDYVLRVQATSRDGFGRVSTLTVPVRVAPAWYQTLWFKILIGLTGLGGVVAVVLGRTAYLTAAQRNLERLVAERTAELEASREQLERIAYFDALTSLPNRRMFVEDFRKALALARRQNGKVALALIDVDEFKAVNDTYGHDAGDAALIEVGARLRAAMRDYECLSRLGGDEFAFLLSIPGDIGQLDAICHRILGLFAAPIRFRDREIPLGVSIGVALYPEDGVNQDDLYRAADMALYAAKRAGRNVWRRAGAEDPT